MVLLLQFSLSPFKQYIVVAVILCRGRQRKAACPALPGGAGVLGAALDQEELISQHRQTGRGLLGAARARGEHPFPRASSIEVLANNNNYSTKENELG